LFQFTLFYFWFLPTYQFVQLVQNIIRLPILIVYVEGTLASSFIYKIKDHRQLTEQISKGSKQFSAAFKWTCRWAYF